MTARLNKSMTPGGDLHEIVAVLRAEHEQTRRELHEDIDEIKQTISRETGLADSIHASHDRAIAQLQSDLRNLQTNVRWMFPIAGIASLVGGAGAQVVMRLFGWG